MEGTFPNLKGFRECVVMWMPLMLIINVKCKLSQTRFNVSFGDVSHHLVQFRWLVTIFWEKATHSVDRIFSLY